MTHEEAFDYLNGANTEEKFTSMPIVRDETARPPKGLAKKEDAGSIKVEICISGHDGPNIHRVTQYMHKDGLMTYPNPTNGFNYTLLQLSNSLKDWFFETYGSQYFVKGMKYKNFLDGRSFEMVDHDGYFARGIKLKVKYPDGKINLIEIDQPDVPLWERVHGSV